MAGQTVCHKHGGASPAARAAARRRIAEAEAAETVRTLGLPIDVTPAEALLQEVQHTAGHVAWLREQVRDTDPRALVWGTTRVKDTPMGEEETREAKPNVWYDLYARERAHLVRVCEAALKAGVDERRVRIAEQQGELVAAAITRILNALTLTPQQWDLVPTIVPRELRAIAGSTE